jgi:hypothetical protein
MVNARGNQFSASSLEDLKAIAKRGDLTAGDIVQPPGAAEWIYALEVPELKGSLRADLEIDLDAPPPAKEMNPVLKWGLAGVLALVAVGAWGYALSLRDTIPQAGDLELIGEKGLSFSEVLVTAENGQLHADASESSPAVATMEKSAKAELLAKRGKWYKLRYQGKEGYAAVDDVVPAYYFGEEKDKLANDPLYNPDRYVFVRNSSWSLLPEGGNKDITTFTFLMSNDAKFAMTDLKLLAKIKDKNDQVIETKEIAVEGTIPAEFSTMVGTLKADKKDKTSVDRIMTSSSFEEMQKENPDLVERWVDGVEVRLEAEGFTEAEIELLEIRAVPPDGKPKTE